jgi:hypothetical protein
MSRKSRMQDLRKAKDRRAKIAAFAGVVVLAGVLALEIPKVMKHSGSSSPAPAATTTTASPGYSGATSAPPTTAPAAAAAEVLPTVGSTRLPNSDVAPKRSKSELYSFSHFAGKDPFVQQVAEATASSGDGEDVPSAPAATTSTSTSSAAATTSAGSSSGSVATTSSVRTLAQTGSATISVNGQAQVVRAGASFPSSNPLFRLISVNNGIAKIGLANGSYASGAQAVSVAMGRTVTLVDTADDVRYKLQLVSVS